MPPTANSTGNPLFGGGLYRLSMGLAPLCEEDWLAPDESFEQELAAKRALFATRPDDVFLALPEAAPAAAELLAWLSTLLPRHHPLQYARHDNQLINRATGERWDLAAPARHPLDLAARLVQDDLCLMEPDHGTYRLTAASVCSPNRWRIADKLGQPVAAIHAPVPGYADSLQRPVEHFFAAAKPGRILGRVNWGITADAAPFQPIAREDAPVAAPDAGATLWLRIERQSLCRLPQTGAVLFTIRTEILRLDTAIETPADAKALAGALRDMSPATLRYKHLTHLRAPLLEWLDAFAATAAGE